MNRQVYTVSGMNQYIRSLFLDDPALNHIYVRGEVSNCKYHSSGHIYFTLKDTRSSIACVMFAGNRRGLNFKMTEGMSVVVYGNISVYEQAGRYQLYASEIRKEGTGALYEAYEALKKKLAAEGLFDQAHKKPLPAFPRRVGIISAPAGAAIQDMLNVTRRRNPYIQIVFCPSAVQGEGAAASVAAALRAMDAADVDVILVGRGGGSIEDLWAFNDEALARTVYACHTPIVSGVGHETDTTIIDYVADMRAPTPSAAAELAVPDIRQVLLRLDDAGRRLRDSMTAVISRYRWSLDRYKTSLRHLDPSRQIMEKRQQLMDMEERMYLLMSHRTEVEKSALKVRIQRLEGLSPMRQLERGYAYVSDEAGHGISDISQVSAGDRIRVTVTNGEILADVVSAGHTGDK